MAGSVRLHPDDVEAIARRTAELLRDLDAGAPGHRAQLVDAAEIARRFGVERGWVYAHANELGAVRLGTGRRPRLRFDLVGVATSPRGWHDNGRFGFRWRFRRASGDATASRPTDAGDGRRVAAHSRTGGVESKHPNRREALMAKAATGGVVEKSTARGTSYALRFRALGERQFIHLGYASEGWTRARAESELAERAGRRSARPMATTARSGGGGGSGHGRSRRSTSSPASGSRTRMSRAAGPARDSRPPAPRTSSGGCVPICCRRSPGCGSTRSPSSTSIATAAGRSGRPNDGATQSPPGGHCATRTAGCCAP